MARAEALEPEGPRFAEWLAEGRHGEMEWLARDPERRTDPEKLLPGCRTVIVLGMNYLQEQAPRGGQKAAVDPTPPGTGRISKYARTRDYHRVIEKKLKKLARLIDREIAPGETTKLYVDYGPVLERAWAERAGVGFAGKHTLLIHPEEGSFHFLAALLTTAEFPADTPAPMPGCGDCRRCIDACPTGAITEPWKLDARRCLSYLTIEKEGPVDEEFWPDYGGNLFGCDICQDVCPYNQSRAKPPEEESPLGPPIVPDRLSLVDLIVAPEDFLAQFEGVSTPLKRAGADSLARNAAIVAMTKGDGESKEALKRLAQNPERPDWLREMARSILERVEEQE